MCAPKLRNAIVHQMSQGPTSTSVPLSLQVMNIKRFLQTLHSSGKGKSPERLLLPPDVVLECEDILFQICDDPFEVKLRAIYEVWMTTLIPFQWEQGLEMRPE